MRKVNLIILTILLCFVIQASAICPAPFEKAKAIALKAQIDELGRYLVFMTVSRNGQETIYIIGYIPFHGLIGIGKSFGNEITVYEYNERTGVYSIAKNKSREPMEPNSCMREAFVIFREMVTEELI